MVDWRRAGAVFVGAMVLGGCTREDGPLSPGQDLTAGQDAARATLVCQVDVPARSMACTPEKPALPEGVSAAVLGGQGEYVLLEASNAVYDETEYILSADVTIRNLVTQTLGTADGVAVDPDGIRVFFIETPAATAGVGVVDIENPDGMGTFVGSNSPYFQYTQSLSPGKVSLPRTWQFNVPSSVISFAFKVYVAARTADEEGIEPGLHFYTQSIGAGGGHSCGLTLSGVAYCWGRETNGKLGNGRFDEKQTTPDSVHAPAGVEFVSISAGYIHSCGVTTTGAAYCWGDGSLGQLGNGGHGGATTPDSVRAPAGTKFIAISTGGVQTCGITSTGTAYCWGYGDDGRLGNGKNGTVTTPDSVAAPAGVKFVSISVGFAHTCGVTTTGAAYCWGQGEYGRLGNGGEGYATTPDSVHAPAGTKFVSVSAGEEHSCGVTSSGAAYCWGKGVSGRLGNGTTFGNMVAPDSVRAPAGVKFVAISTGFTHTCGLASTGAAYCWGEWKHGKLGNGATVDVSIPDSVAAPEGIKFVAISTGTFHTCGVTTTGAAYCWGYGDDGALGNGGIDNVPTPSPVLNVTNFALLDPLIPAAGAGGLLPARSSFASYALAGNTANTGDMPAVCTAGHA